MEKIKVVVVVGATASGKTGLAVQIAKEFDGEVISADSRQVYRTLDIGTAKTTPAEMSGVPHHLIDIADVDEVYTASDFRRDATKAITEIDSRDHLPIIAGGTFFYVDTLLGRITTPQVTPDPQLREYLQEMSTDVLYTRLEELDPDRAFAIDKNNKRRLIRALEIVESLGKVPAQKPVECPYDVLTIGIEADKETLRSKYKQRAKEWLSRGFKAEVEELLAAGVSRERLHEIGFEYQLMLAHIDGELDEAAFLQRFIEKNWQYAKRQMTWLKRDASIEWYTPDSVSDIIARIHTFLQY